jgi:hypothetical protein
MTMNCPIRGHEHDLQVLDGTWEGVITMFECSETGSRWVEVPAGTKASTTHHVPQKVSEELGEG